MNIKKYRAVTMRDALEQVKSDLGDEALVLGSRNIRRGGFLGLGGTQLVEVSVSTDFANQNKKKQTTKTRNQQSGLILGLQESNTVKSERSTGSVFSALAARAYSSELVAAKLDHTDITTAVLERAKARPVQTTTAAPTTAAVKADADADESKHAPKREQFSTELDRLYSEIREVKFTLGAFAANNRPVLQQSSIDFNEADDVIYDSPYYETFLHLENTGLAPDKAKAATRSAVGYAGEKTDVCELAEAGLTATLPSWITFAKDPLQCEPGSPNPVVALIGPTGVGKTTTIAKLAARCALRERRRVELITLDTYRIAAVEQLKVYAEIIGAGFHVPRSILELDALIRRFSGEATILVDTIGRSACDLADQMELADYLRGNEQITKSLLIQATMHPVDALAAISKFGLFGVDNLMITKLDETSRPGAVISTIATSRLPISYICNGQRVPEDIELASPKSVAAGALRSLTARAA